MFSGIGAPEIILKKKHKIIGACEIDKHARQVYSRRFPGVKIWPDATKINPEELPDFELLAAGPPCQAFSYAGRRLGLEESRGTLFYEVFRIAKQKRPRYVIIENVRGLPSHDGGRTLANILASLQELGYDTEWKNINSSDYVPQERERIFIIAHLRKRGSKIPPKGSHKGQYQTEDTDQKDLLDS